MRRSVAVAGSAAWFAAVGGTFGCLLPCLLGYWHLRGPLPYWDIARTAGALLIGAGLVPIAGSFIEFVRADGTPIPVASPPRLVTRGFYRHVRNPIYAGFLLTLLGQALLFGSLGLLEYALVAGGIGLAAARWYEEPRLTRKFGADYRAYQRAVPPWLPRLRRSRP